MRNLRRSIAKHNMKKRGITGANWKKRDEKGKSFFSKQWRGYSPENVPIIKKNKKRRSA